MQADDIIDMAQNITIEKPHCLTVAQSFVQVNMDSLRFAVSIYSYIITLFQYYVHCYQIKSQVEEHY